MGKGLGVGSPSDHQDVRKVLVAGAGRAMVLEGPATPVCINPRMPRTCSPGIGDTTTPHGSAGLAEMKPILAGTHVPFLVSALRNLSHKES